MVVGSVVASSYPFLSHLQTSPENKNCETIELEMWRNDVSIFQVLLFSEKDETISCQWERKTAEAEIKIYELQATQAYSGPFLGYGDKKRVLPSSPRENSFDVAVPVDYIALQKGQKKTLVVELTTKKVKNDMFQNTLIFKGIKNQWSLPVNISCLPLDFPKLSQQDVFDVEFWQYPYRVAEFFQVPPFSREHFELLEKDLTWYQVLGGKHTTVTICEDPWDGQTYGEKEVRYPSMIKWFKNQDTYTFDYNDFDAWIMFNEKIGLGKTIQLFSIAPWHQSFIYEEAGKKKIEPYEVGSRRYKEMWTIFLEDLVHHLDKNGWLEKSYLSIDERGFHDAVFEVVEKVREKTGKVLQLSGAMDHFQEKKTWAEKIQRLTIGDNAQGADSSEFKKFFNSRKEKNQKTTLYSCTEHFPGNFTLSDPIESYWTVLNAGKHSDGFLRWGFDAWVKDPLKDSSMNAFEPGDSFFVYPDKKRQLIYPSLRLLMMREGIKDMVKLAILQTSYPFLKEKIIEAYQTLQFKGYLTNQPWQQQQAVNQIKKEIQHFKEALHQLNQEVKNYETKDR